MAPPGREALAEQSRTRNPAAFRSGRVGLRPGSANSLPFHADSFDEALAAISMQVWPVPVAGLRKT
jgi:hypothetical protein